MGCATSHICGWASLIGIPAAPELRALLQRRHRNLDLLCRCLWCRGWLRRCLVDCRPAPRTPCTALPPVAQPTQKRSPEAAAGPCLTAQGTVHCLAPSACLMDCATAAVRGSTQHGSPPGVGRFISEVYLTRCTAASLLPSRCTASHVGTSATRTAARMSPIALIASKVVCQDVISSAGSIGVARHGSACSQTSGDTVSLASERQAHSWHQTGLSSRKLDQHLSGRLAMFGFSVQSGSNWRMSLA